MTKMFVFLAPRANGEAEGHFYWFLRRVIEFFRTNRMTAIVIVPNYDCLEVFAPFVLNSRIELKVVGSDEQWGYDIGNIKPSSLSSEILKAINSSNFVSENPSKIIIVANESSVSLLFATLGILLDNNKFYASVNLVDFGFWERFLNYNFAFKIALDPIFRVVKLIERLSLTTNSPKFMRRLEQRGFDRVDVWRFYQLSSPYRSSNEPVFSGLNQRRAFTILILPWPDDYTRVVSVVSTIMEGLEFDTRVHVHLKSNDAREKYDLLYKQVAGNKERFKLTKGVLGESEYAKVLQSADLVWLPYRSEYHAESGSGRAVDSLVFGTPIVIDKESNLFHVLKNHPLAKYVYPADCSSTSSVLDAITQSKKIIFDEHFITDRTKIRSEIARAATNWFSPEAMFQQVESRSVGMSRGQLPLFCIKTIMIYGDLLHFVLLFLYRRKNYTIKINKYSPSYILKGIRARKKEKQTCESTPQ